MKKTAPTNIARPRSSDALSAARLKKVCGLEKYVKRIPKPGEALQLLKDGKKVARRGWNGKGLWLELQVPDAHSKMTLPYIFMSYPADAQNTPGARVPWPGAQGGRRRNRPQAHKHHHRPRERRDTARLRRWRSVAGYPARCGAHQVSRVSPPTLHSRRPAARGAAGASIRPLCR
jgi:hypothetical protein